MAQRQRKQKRLKNTNLNQMKGLNRSKRFKRGQKKKAFPESTSSSSPSTDDDTYNNHSPHVYNNSYGHNSNNAAYRNQHQPLSLQNHHSNPNTYSVPYSAQLAKRYYGNNNNNKNNNNHRANNNINYRNRRSNDENYRHNNSSQRTSNPANLPRNAQQHTLYNGHYNKRPSNPIMNRNRMNNAIRPSTINQVQPQTQHISTNKKPLAVAHNLEHFYNQPQNHVNDNVFRSMLKQNPKHTKSPISSPNHSSSRSKSKSRSRSSKSKKLKRTQQNPKEENNNIPQQKRSGHNKYWSGQPQDKHLMQFNKQIAVAHAISINAKSPHYPVKHRASQTQQQTQYDDDESDEDTDEEDSDDFDDDASSNSAPALDNNPSPQAYSHDTFHTNRHHSSVLSPPNESVLNAHNEVSPPPPPPLQHHESMPIHPHASRTSQYSMYNNTASSYNQYNAAPSYNSNATWNQHMFAQAQMYNNDNSYMYNRNTSFPQYTQVRQVSRPPNLSTSAVPDAVNNDSIHSSPSDDSCTSYEDDYKGNHHRFVTRGQVTHRGAVALDHRLRGANNSNYIATPPADNRQIYLQRACELPQSYASSVPLGSRNSNKTHSSTESTSFTPTVDVPMSVSCDDLPLKPTLSNNASTVSISTSEIARVRSNCKIDRYGFPLKKEESVDDVKKEDHKEHIKRQKKKKKKRSKDKDDQRKAARKEKALLLQWQNILFPSSTSKKSKINWCNLKAKGSNNQKIRSLMKSGGIPQPFRSFAWSNFCNVNNTKHKSKNVGLYERLLSQNKEQKNRYEEIIWKDIHRTFRANLKYGAVGMNPGKGTEVDEAQLVTESQETLYNVLSAFSIYNEDIGYCQGMQAISALLLMYMIEEDVFFILNTIAREEKYGNLCTCWNMEEIHLRFAQFDYCFKEYLPKLYKHLVKNNITDVSMFGATAWFITIFISSGAIDFDLIVRIWDMYLAKGIKIVFKFGIGYLKYLEKQLLKTKQFELLITTLNNGFKIISQNKDNEKFIHMALNVKIKQKQITKWAKKYHKRKPQ